VQRIVGLILMTVILSPVSGFAQSRKRSAAKPTSASTSAAAKTSAVQRAGAARVADQIKTLTRFIYLLGGVAKGLEGVDDATRRNEASPAIMEQVTRNKATVRASIKNVKDGLDKLEIDFRATPELQRYYIRLAGVAAGAASAEEFAAANQFDKAGRKLLEVVNQLTDVLLEMR
jgi:cell division protein FtsB